MYERGDTSPHLSMNLLGVAPLPVTVGNEGLGLDPLLKMYVIRVGILESWGKNT